MTRLFAAQAHNNAWANHRLGKACLGLPEAEVSKDRNSFFGSIIATLNHILIVDWFYVTALEGDCMGVKAFDPEVPFPDLPKLIDAQRDIDQRLILACDAPDAELWGRAVELKRRDMVQVERFDRTFLHLIQHQIHHRGQVHDMLSGANVEPPQLDEFYLAWEPDRKLRAPDLEAIGTSEEAIWS